MDTKKQAKIEVTTAERRWLEEALGVSRKTVSEALNYRSQSPLAEKIRTLAIKRGGHYISPGEEMATTFESNGDMIQTWGDRARIRVSRHSGEVLVTVAGEEPRHYPSMTAAQLISEQRRIGLLFAR